MNAITIHENDPTVFQKLSQLAQNNNRTPEDEARDLLRWAVFHADRIQTYEEQKPFTPLTSEQIEEARAFRKRFAHMQTTDCVELLREDRDR